MTIYRHIVDICFLISWFMSLIRLELKIERRSCVNWLSMIFHTRSHSRQRLLTIIPKYRNLKRKMRITGGSRSFTTELKTLLFLLSDVYNFDEIMWNLCTAGYHLIVSSSRVIWNVQISLLKNQKYHHSLWQVNKVSVLLVRIMHSNMILHRLETRYSRNHKKRNNRYVRSRSWSPFLGYLIANLAFSIFFHGYPKRQWFIVNHMRDKRRNFSISRSISDWFSFWTLKSRRLLLLDQISDNCCRSYHILRQIVEITISINSRIILRIRCEQDDRYDIITSSFFPHAF